MNFSLRQILRALLLPAVAAVPACAPTAPVSRDPDALADLHRRTATDRELAVLFIGNSYSFGVPRAFEKLAATRGKSIRTGHSTFGGWTLARHADFPGTLEKIRGGHWDVVIIQEQSRIPALPRRQREAAMLPPLRRLVAEVRRQNAIPVLYQTWGRQHGDPDRPGDDFAAMNHRLRDGYRAAARDAGGLAIIPAGDLWETEVSAGRGKRIFMPDGSHPTPAGDALTASAVFSTLYDG